MIVDAEFEGGTFLDSESKRRSRTIPTDAIEFEDVFFYITRMCSVKMEQELVFSMHQWTTNDHLYSAFMLVRWCDNWTRRSHLQGTKAGWNADRKTSVCVQSDSGYAFVAGDLAALVPPSGAAC